MSVYDSSLFPHLILIHTPPYLLFLKFRKVSAIAILKSFASKQHNESIKQNDDDDDDNTNGAYSISLSAVFFSGSLLS